MLRAILDFTDWLADKIAIVIVAVGIIGAVLLVGCGLYHLGRWMLLGSARNDDPYFDDEDFTP